MIATVENMRKVYPADKTVTTPEGEMIHIVVSKPFAYSPETDERFSANPNDYWQLADDDPVTDSEGSPMVLAWERSGVEIIEA
jgi:hypothetical protein